MPSGPCEPAAPTSPLTPCGPSDPALPSGPCRPVAPWAPCGPFGPSLPLAPVSLRGSALLRGSIAQITLVVRPWALLFLARRFAFAAYLPCGAWRWPSCAGPVVCGSVRESVLCVPVCGSALGAWLVLAVRGAVASCSAGAWGWGATAWVGSGGARGRCAYVLWRLLVFVALDLPVGFVSFSIPRSLWKSTYHVDISKFLCQRRSSIHRRYSAHGEPSHERGQNRTMDDCLRHASPVLRDVAILTYCQ